MTLEQLAVLVERALEAVAYRGPDSARVRAVPNLRTIRYYTTLGLLAPPAEMRGRKAFYGRRHLLQLVAIKQLQAKGKQLVEVQRCLAGADDGSLAAWAGLPAEFWDRAAETCRPTSRLRLWLRGQALYGNETAFGVRRRRRPRRARPRTPSRRDHKWRCICRWPTV